MTRIKKYYLIASAALLWGTMSRSQETQKIFLSGTGSDQTVNWEFFCTGGSNAGKWTTIAVPSCWELQGFGKYDYGFAKDSARGREQGRYRYRFNVPPEWKGSKVNIVFEGVMTDAEVRINNRPAGPVHQGAFYAFRYDISRLIQYGRQNLLEVTVSKHSANESVNAAERRGDYWIFGGIFRPVWLEVLPPDHIEQIFIDAKADGLLAAQLRIAGKADRVDARIFDSDGKQVGQTFSTDIPRNADQLKFTNQYPQVKNWTPESPALYHAVFSLIRKGKVVHSVFRRFGFRTIELHQRDGIYVNGVKIKMKGVNRHSFRPETGRTLCKKNSIEDVILMREMNMNAVRMSHYPPDDHFLDACDSLGLFVMDELAGWHGNYDTPTGSQLLEEMIGHDGNHPSVILWANGNEGGHNTELDTLFNRFDLQRRPVVHPWQLYNGIETQHYREYNYGIGNYENGREIVMPTEFLHGQFDGGHGAGLEDYWEKMWHDPLSAGGFLWDFADNAVVRKDLHDSLDTDQHRAADGILGPHHEKEGSFYSIKEIWSPVHFPRQFIGPDFDGRLQIGNRYFFTNLEECHFNWRLKRFDVSSVKEDAGTIPSPHIPPAQTGILHVPLPNNWRDFDVLYITATDGRGQEIFTWSFPISAPAMTAPRMVSLAGTNPVSYTENDSLWVISVKDLIVSIERKSGLLRSVINAKGPLPFSKGPFIEEGISNFKGCHLQYDKDNNLVIESSFDRKESYNTIKWTVLTSGWIRLEVRYFPGAYFTNYAGLNFSLPENEIRSVTYMGYGPYRVWKNRMKGGRFDVWQKTYNNTETGESPWIYPEFKGYYAGFYGGYFVTSHNRFTVAVETESVFLRLYTPAWKTDRWHNYEPLFPAGDISFMQGISSIGTKTQRNETTGPMGLKNIFYDYEKDPSRALKLSLYFNFSANQ